MEQNQSFQGTEPDKHYYATAAAGTPVVITLAADASKRHGLEAFDLSLDSAPSGASLTVEVASVVVWSIDLLREGEYTRNFATNPIKTDLNQELKVTLTPSAGVIGKLNLATL